MLLLARQQDKQARQIPQPQPSGEERVHGEHRAAGGETRLSGSSWKSKAWRWDLAAEDGQMGKMGSVWARWMSLGRALCAQADPHALFFIFVTRVGGFWWEVWAVRVSEDDPWRLC